MDTNENCEGFEIEVTKFPLTKIGIEIHSEISWKNNNEFVQMKMTWIICKHQTKVWVLLGFTRKLCIGYNDIGMCFIGFFF